MTGLPLRRRALLAAPALFLTGAAPPPIRFGIVQFGTAQWIAATIQRHGLDSRHGLTLRPRLLAGTEAGRIALMAGGADIVIADWPFAAAQRQAGTPLCFAPFSAALGGIMVPAASPVRRLDDLAGRRLGVAGGPLDKSWLLVRAAAKARAGIDLAVATRIAYGAPPLLGAKLEGGELDALLTFWTFTARLEAKGYREVLSVDDCAAQLGLPRLPPMIGFVFHEPWARTNHAAVSRFLAAVDEAERLLATDATDWGPIRPLMDAPDEALFRALRRRFLAGISAPRPVEMERLAAGVLQALLTTGGPRATGGLTRLPPGLFWDRADDRA